MAETGIERIVDENGAESAELNRALRFAIGVPVIGFLILLATLGVLVSDLRDVSDLVDHTDEVIAKANEVRSLISEHEAVYRSELLTSAPMFHERIALLRGEIDRQFAQLKTMVDDNSSQRRLIDEIEGAFQYRVQRTFEVLDAREAGEDFRAMVATGEGTRRFAHVGDLFRHFIRVEEEFKTARHRRQDQVFALATAGTIVIGTAVALFLVLFSRRALLQMSRQYGRTVAVLEQTAERLRRSRDEAESANRMKSAFLANMSHEIRTPLGAVLGFAELLREPSLSEAEKATYLDIIARSGEQLGGLINDILDLSKVESGALSVESIPFNVREMISDVLTLLGVKAEEKGLTLHASYEKDLPEKVCSDPTRVKQILMNIIGNSVKFTERGGIEVRVECESCSDKNALIRIQVADSGIGMSPEQREKLFRPFSQADESMTRKFGGTGLGLALSKRLAQLIGGDVRLLKSEQGQGSIFEVTFRSEVVAPEKKEESRRRDHKLAPEPAYQAPSMLRGARILIVEDSPDNRLLISQYLKPHGAILETANDGVEGVMKAMNGEFDLVLIDIQMPMMDGYEATRLLRQKGFTKPIIALSAHVVGDVREKCRDAGCTDYLSKPITARALIAMLVRHLGRGTASEAEHLL